MEIAAQPSIFNKPAQGWQAFAILFGVLCIIGLLIWLLVRNPNPNMVKKDQYNTEDLEEAEEVEEAHEIPAQHKAIVSE